MLIPFSEVHELVTQLGKTITGILHIGAHECEERHAYNEQGVQDDAIYWIEGNEEKVQLNREKGIPHIIKALVYNEEKEVDFHITKNLHIPGNSESSSILPFGVHASYYPHVKVGEVRKCRTITLDSLIREEKIPIQDLNFWNLDIQGVEFEALLSAGDMIQFADCIYVEVNLQTLYEGCALLPKLDAFLQINGFKRIQLKMTEQGWGDALYVRA